jgi:hypothetical protein
MRASARDGSRLGGRRPGRNSSRASLKDVPSDPAFRDTFLREWAKVRPAALIERLGLGF